MRMSESLCLIEANINRNVDRLFALWQAIYPDSHVAPQVTTVGTFTNNPGMTEDINTRQFFHLLFNQDLCSI